MKLKHILVIDDNVTNLKFAEKTLKPYYKVSLLISGAQTLKFLSKNKPDLILLDINMPDMDGYETIKNIKANQDLENVPVIFLSAITDSESEVRGIELGAVDFINKPFVPQSMLSRVKMHLELSEYKKELESKVSEKTEMIEHLQDVMMLSLAELVECRDENTGGHVKRTAEYVRLLTEEIVDADLYSDILTPEYIKDIVRSAPLHDIGKIGINDSTLLKTTSLDNDEFEYMKKHVELGSQSLQKMINETGDESFLYIAKDMAHYHHEKWDGTG
ncbi:response regulator [Romboutsia sp. Marseille-P6047]|uniref:response regulator n=1 Tax=Romboutsia sp. Marseille-P6047 TaxID=2161817 RepID=UPI001FAADE66|nr:response regulator [Romboutsia sp. Marseille-P6047]